MFNARKAAPTKALGHDKPGLSFLVWAATPAYQEDVKPWKCVAAFQYLWDALDYIAALQDAGVDCVFQSPADCRAVHASEMRVVFKAA